MNTKRTVLISVIAFIAMAVVFIATLDWSGKKDITSNKVIIRTPKQTRPVSTKTLPSPPEAVFDPAVSKTEDQVASVPEPPKEVTYEEAEAAFRDKRYDDAVELFTLYIDRKNKNPWGHYMLGLSAWKAGDHEIAETAFTQALKLDPFHTKSWLNLSRVLLDTDRPTEALLKIDEALAIDPESNVAYRLRGRAFHQLGQINEAIGAYRRAILTDNNDAWSMNNMGLIFIEEGRFDEALPPLARAVELKSDIAVFLNNLGMVLERMGHFRAAEEKYQSAVMINALHEKASANLARLETVLQDPGVEPLDLRVIAQGFIEEIESWSVAVGDDERPEFVEPEIDTVVVNEIDSIVVSNASASDTNSTENWQE